MTSWLKQMREFIKEYPGADILSQLDIDYTDAIPNCAGLFPSGLVEVNRTTYINGDVSVLNQCNFALYTVFEKAPNEDEGATINADWLMDFQKWVQKQSVLGKAPTFGDEPRNEKIVAQNGAIYSADEEGTAVYAIQISVTFINNYEEGVI